MTPYLILNLARHLLKCDEYYKFNEHQNYERVKDEQVNNPLL